MTSVKHCLRFSETLVSTCILYLHVLCIVSTCISLYQLASACNNNNNYNITSIHVYVPVSTCIYILFSFAMFVLPSDLNRLHLLLPKHQHMNHLVQHWWAVQPACFDCFVKRLCGGNHGHLMSPTSSARQISCRRSSFLKRAPRRLSRSPAGSSRSQMRRAI